MLPKFGKDGFLIFGGVEYPIYSWMIGSRREFSNHRTSVSFGYPTRRPSEKNEIITLRGPQIDRVFHDAIILSESVSFDIGWNNIGAETRDVFRVYGSLIELRIDINYQRTATPSTSWNAAFMGVNGVPNPIIPQYPFEDDRKCNEQQCDQLITTTDVSLNGGQVRHIATASISYLFPRLEHRTSISGGYPVGRVTDKDRLIELVVHGDYDYWFDRALSSITNQPRDYRFYFGSGVNDYYIAQQMKVLEVGNLLTNIETGEICAAVVRLGVSYGG